jgi:vancomycin resistance protein VanJ
MSTDTESRPRPGCLRRLALFGARVALSMVGAVWCVQVAWGESTWLTAIVTFAPPIIYLGVPTASLLFALLVRDRRAIWTGVIGVCLALGTVGRPSLNVHRGPTRTMDTIRIVTWNVHGQMVDIPRFRSELTALAPDIVCLQEANHERFSECLPDAEVARGGEVMTLVQGKIESSRRITDESEKPWFRSPVETRVKLPQGELAVLNVHLYSYQLRRLGHALRARSRPEVEAFAGDAIELREREADYVFGWLEESSGPRVVAGDFNNPPRGRLYGAFAGLLADTFAASGNGFGWSFPHRLPLLRIDYIWASADLEPLNCRTLPVGPSDHRPVVADVRFR